VGARLLGREKDDERDDVSVGAGVGRVVEEEEGEVGAFDEVAEVESCGTVNKVTTEGDGVEEEDEVKEDVLEEGVEEEEVEGAEEGAEDDWVVGG